jgi:PAS domain S-box-containing protein
VRRSDVELRELRELREAMETIPAIAWTVTPDGANIFVNKRWRDYTGLSADQVAAGARAIIHPEDQSRNETARSRSITTGEPFEEEVRVRAADGTYRWFLVRGVPLKGSDGAILKWSHVATDIDDRKRAEIDRQRSEQALRRSEAYLAEAQRLAHTGSWAASAGQATYWSEETFRIFERPLAEGLPDGKEHLEWVHPDDREHYSTVAGEAAKARRDFAVEFRIVLPNGTIKHLQNIGHPVFDATGELIEWVGTIVDVTARRNADRERHRVQRLESERETAVVNERTRLAGEIHDTLAQGLAMIVMQLADAEAKLGQEWSRAEKPLSMVRELAVDSLAYARRSVSMLRPNVGSGGLARSIRDVADSMRRHFTGSLTLDVTGDDVLLDAAVESALVGIAREALTNAVKHSRATRITVELNFARGRAVRLLVADDGTGFDAGAVPPDAFGLVSMQDRAGRAHVALTFVTEPGAGTTVIASWSPPDEIAGA